MQRHVLEWLACPHCGGTLRIADDDGSLDIESGDLVCAGGHAMPVRDGVPRLTTAATAAESIQQTYDTAWSQFEYGDAVWSRDTGDRIRLFLDEVRLKPEDLRGKRVLDAGCGTGILTHGITDFGCDAVGTDVSEIVVRAHRNFNADGKCRTHFIQADIDAPPFRDGTFDIVYAGGSLHCNPDPHATFHAIARKLKPGGRMWVWLYRQRTDLKYRLQQSLRSVIQRLPAPLQKAAVAIWLPQAMLRQYLKIALGRCPSDERRSWRERYLLLLDHYTPQYRWEHTEEQVRGWYEEAGFGDLAFTYNAWGFGVIGTKRGQPA